MRVRRNKNYSFIKFMALRPDVNFSVAIATTTGYCLFGTVSPWQPEEEGKHMRLDCVSHLTPSFGLKGLRKDKSICKNFFRKGRSTRWDTKFLLWFYSFQDNSWIHPHRHHHQQEHPRITVICQIAQSPDLES